MTPQHLTLSSEPLEEFKDGLNTNTTNTASGTNYIVKTDNRRLVK